MTKPTARFYPEARKDLIEQASWFSENASAQVADRFLTSVKQTTEALAKMPSKGRLWRNLRSETANIRVWKVESFPKVLIFYRVEDKGISVVRILHSSRDLPPLLQGLD